RVRRPLQAGGAGDEGAAARAGRGKGRGGRHPRFVGACGGAVKGGGSRNPLPVEIVTLSELSRFERVLWPRGQAITSHAWLPQSRKCLTPGPVGRGCRVWIPGKIRQARRQSRPRVFGLAGQAQAVASERPSKK